MYYDALQAYLTTTGSVDSAPSQPCLPTLLSAYAMTDGTPQVA
jgi:hypothetical protein